jgi:hypothetical protein
MASTTIPLDDLTRAVHSPRDNLGAWRWTVRRQLVPVRDRLVRERADRAEAWLSARASRTLRERDVLLVRLNELASQVLVESDVDRVAGELDRLVGDIEHHAQRVHDLAYDDVELEIGGSE